MEHSKQRIWLRLALSLGLWASGLVLGILLLPLLWQAFAPFVLAFVLAYLLNPWVERCCLAMGLGRPLVVGLLLSFGFLSLGALLWLLIPELLWQLSTLGESWETLFALVAESLHTLEEGLKASAPLLQGDLPSALLSGLLDQGLLALEEGLAWGLKSLVGQVGQQAVKLPGLMIAFFVFSMACYFFSVDFPRLEKRLKSHWSGELLSVAGALEHSAVVAFGGYLRAQFLLSLGVFVLLLGGFWLMELPLALVLALGIACLDFIPMIGAGLILLPWTLLAFCSGWDQLGWQLLLLWLVTALYRRLAEPKILGQQTGLSSLLSLVSIYVGLQWGGIWGMIFAPVLLLVGLNCLGLGLFRQLRQDLSWAKGELSAFFQDSK